MSKKDLLRDDLLSTKNSSYTAEVRKYIIGAFLADMGKGDITSQILIPSSLKTEARIIAKQSGILAGIEEAEYFLASCKKYISSLKIKFQHSDGDTIKKRDSIAQISGKASEIFLIERTILNLLQRMSGIATLTKTFKAKMKPSVELAATRKTHWGILDKKACVTGGALPHRLGLYDAVLIKDNHLAVLKKDFQQILQKLLQTRSTRGFNEIELDNIPDLKNFLQIFQQIPSPSQQKLAMRILLDNMNVQQLKLASQMVKKSTLPLLLEASGGVNLTNIKKISQTGVDIISVGTLTHSAPSLDFSLKINA